MTNIQFDKTLKCGADFVSVKIIENGEQQHYGNIILPDTYEANGRLAFAEVMDVGVNAHEKLGIVVGDYVMIDRLATFAHTAPSAALKYDSVICKANKDKSDFFPLKDTLFVENDQKDETINVGGVYVQNYADRLNTGTILKVGFEANESYPFNVGDHVMMVKGGDMIKLSDKVVHIFKKDMIVCTIED